MATTSFKLTNYLESICQEEAFDLKTLQLSYTHLSTLYRSKKGLSSCSFSKEKALAYSFARMPATMAVSSQVLERLKQIFPSFTPITLLDLGSGPGSALWSAFDSFSSLQNFTAIEANAFFIEISKKIYKEFYFSPLINSKWQQTTFNTFLTISPETPSYNLICVNYVLGEFSGSFDSSFLEKIWLHTKDVLVIIEPGTPEGFHHILRARSFFLNSVLKDTSQILAPCPHSYECPLQNTLDWCHFSAYVPRSKTHMHLKEGSLPYEQEKFSYLIIKRRHFENILPARIIKKPLLRSGHIHFDLCTTKGVHLRKTISKRQKDLFQQAKSLKWGDSWPFSLDG